MLFDIETTDLKADRGWVLTIAWKWAPEETVYTLAINDSPDYENNPVNDLPILEAFRDELEKADVIIGHYSTRFDYPFLQSRLLIHGAKVYPLIHHIDTWRIARATTQVSSRRLGFLAEMLGVEGKTPFHWPTWTRAIAGHKPSVQYVVDHCAQDVMVLEQVYNKLRPLRLDVPRLSIYGCPTCGSENVVDKGRVRTLKTNKHRYVCRDCGHWWRT